MMELGPRSLRGAAPRPARRVVSEPRRVPGRLPRAPGGPLAPSSLVDRFPAACRPVGARYVSSAGRRGALEVLGVLVLFPARLWLAGMLLAVAAFQGVSGERVARRWGVVGRRDAVRRPQLDYRMLTDALARS